MAMLRVCSHRGCTTLTLGELCVEHEEPVPERIWLLPLLGQAAERDAEAAELSGLEPQAQR